MEDQAPYACQITANPCPRDCGNAQCAAPEAAIVPYPAAHGHEWLSQSQLRLLDVEIEALGRTIYPEFARFLRRLFDERNTLAENLTAQEAAPVPDDGAVPPFFVGFQKRAEELQLAYFAMKQRAQAAEADVAYLTDLQRTTEDARDEARLDLAQARQRLIVLEASQGHSVAQIRLLQRLVADQSGISHVFQARPDAPR